MMHEWVARVNGTDTWVTKAHYVESEISDRAVTNCGRQMRKHNSAGRLMAFPLEIITSERKCARCQEG